MDVQTSVCPDTSVFLNNSVCPNNIKIQPNNSNHIKPKGREKNYFTNKYENLRRKQVVGHFKCVWTLQCVITHCSLSKIVGLKLTTIAWG